MEPEKKEEEKIEKSHTASPKKTILQLLQNCIGPTFRIGQEIEVIKLLKNIFRILYFFVISCCEI